ncbi:MAG: hypothetical protein RIS75_1042 [Actinomycetota bacterium]|jgi:AcrR family transcriptional regulator
MSTPESQVRQGTHLNRTSATRQAIVNASRQVIADGGIKNLSMASVADVSGVARATVYNHVRDKHELLDLVAQDVREEIIEIASNAAEQDFLAALIAVAHYVATDPMISKLRTTDADVLLQVISSLLELSDDVAKPVMEILLQTSAHADLAAVEVVLRWLSTYCLLPATAAEREVGAEIVFHSLTQDATQ